MEIELTTPSLTFEFGNQGSGTIQTFDYLSLERLNEYLYKATFDVVPDYIPTNNINTGACTSFVKDGKLYRNFDWKYDDRATFIVRTKDFEGIAYIDGLNGNDKLNLSLVEQLPYHITDGCNNYGIRVSEHVLFNDFDYVGSGDNPIQLIPYKILTECESLDYLEGTEFQNYIANLSIPTLLTEAEYLLHFIVTDGTDTYYVGPSEDGYEVIDITDNPKLTNFKWVDRETVNRTDSDLQDRPTGIERWNLINNSLDDLYFTEAYVAPNRLSEFIGINGTTKDSTDEELESIYDTAHQAYLERTRNGYTWQTVHSVIYDDKGIIVLYTQEDFHKAYSSADTIPNEYVHYVAKLNQDYYRFTRSDNTEVNIDLSRKQNKLIAGQNITIDEDNVISAYGGSGDGNIFYVTYGETEFEDIKQAIDDGKLCICIESLQENSASYAKIERYYYNESSDSGEVLFADFFNYADTIIIYRLYKTMSATSEWTWSREQLVIQERLPFAPSTGTYVLKSVDRELTWVAE